MTKLLPGKREEDGNQTVRTVIVETQDGENQRPVVKLCILKAVEEEIADNQEETKKKFFFEGGGVVLVQQTFFLTSKFFAGWSRSFKK